MASIPPAAHCSLPAIAFDLRRVVFLNGVFWGGSLSVSVAFTSCATRGILPMAKAMLGRTGAIPPRLSSKQKSVLLGGEALYSARSTYFFSTRITNAIAVIQRTLLRENKVQTAMQRSCGYSKTSTTVDLMFLPEVYFSSLICNPQVLNNKGVSSHRYWHDINIHHQIRCISLVRNVQYLYFWCF